MVLFVPAGEEECLREKQARLKAMFRSIDPDEKSFVELMTQIYHLQHVDINSGHDALALKGMWPFLFSEMGV